MPNPNRQTLSKADLEELDQLSTMLQAMHRRNKNQHRRSHWYRHFDHFRRQLQHLLSDIKLADPKLDTPATTSTVSKPSSETTPASIAAHLAHGERRRRDREVAMKSAAARREAWATGDLVRRWHTSFSQLVADPQFAALGLVLVAALARAAAVLGVLKDKNGSRREPDQKVEEGHVEDGRADEDLGVSVQRGDVDMQGEESPSSLAATKKRREAQVGTAKKRKKQKSKSVIDDLFSGLS